jgi:hypothetical protein
MQSIEWRTQCKIGNINFQESNFNETGWKLAKEELQKLAEPILENNGRNQIKEIRSLMKEVDPKKRQLIFEQLLTRTDSLIDFINESLDKMDKKGSSKNTAIRVFDGLRPRKWLVSPTAKLILKHYFRDWLKRNIFDV